jgi:hypothetical protein
MKSFSFFYIFLLLSCSFSCIQVKDRINPIITDFQIKPEYTLQDTICISTIYTDNERLAKILVLMNASADGTVTGTLGTQIFSKEIPITLDRGGRRYDASTCFAIPVDTSPGDYSVTVIVTDAAGNSTRTVKNTKILPDQVKPVISVAPKITIFKNNAFVNLVADAAGVYTICQLDVLNFNGDVSVTDNQAIRNLTVLVTVTRNSREVNVFVNSTDLNNTTTRRISLIDFFVPPIRIPEKDAEDKLISNGDILTLNISASDFAGNSGVNTIPIKFKIDCDRVSPVITVGKSRPQLDSIKRELLVVEKGNFKFLRGTITDNKNLANLNVVFKRTNGTVVSNKDYVLTGSSAKLEDILTDTYAIPSTAAINDEYQVVLTVTDNSGNQSIYSLKITIKVDDPPLITALRPVVKLANGNETEIVLSTDAQNPTIIPIDAKQIILQGKITDDNFLAYMQQFFISNGSSKQLVDAQNLQELVYDFTQTPLINTFDLLANGQVQNYQIEIRAKDNKVEVKRIFYFVAR